MYNIQSTLPLVDTVLRGQFVSKQIFWSRQDTLLFQYKTLCVKRTSVIWGQRTLFLQIWPFSFVFTGQG